MGLDKPLRCGLEEAVKMRPAPGELSVEVLKHGTLSVEYYAPPNLDMQTPHTRDELYVVVKGSGTFECAARRCAFAAGDVLFACAGVEHRFLDFSPDFATWVVFYGPEGGESP